MNPHYQVLPAPDQHGLLFEALTIAVDDQAALNPFGVPGAYGVLMRVQAWDFLISPVNDAPTIKLAASSFTVSFVFDGWDLF